jgi:hypothetical protein
MEFVMKFVAFSLLAFLIGIGIGYFYLMNKKEKAKIVNRKTKTLLISAFGTFLVLFVIAATLSTLSVKLF